MTARDRVEAAEEAYRRSLEEARSGTTPGGWSRCLSSARQLRTARQAAGTHPLRCRSRREEVPGAGCPTILVVEDDGDVREAVCQLLSRAGQRATGVANGSDALDYLSRTPVLPRVIVLDMWMPVMSGREFRARQLADPRLSAIPVIVVSATEDASDMMAAGYYEKPYRVDELVTSVRSLAMPS